MDDEEVVQDRYMLFTLLCDTTLDFAYLILLGVVLFGLYRSFNISPVYVFLSIMFCLTTTIHVVGDIGLNYLIFYSFVDRITRYGSAWASSLSMIVGGAKLFARFYIVLLQAVMSANRFCAIVFATEYDSIFTMRKTILIVALLFVMTLPSFPFYAFELGGCLYMFVLTHLAWVHSVSSCRDIHEISLIAVNCVVLSAVIFVDVIVLILLWRQKKKHMLQNLNSFWSELQFIVMTVILGVLTAISIALRTSLDYVPLENFFANYMQKVVDVILSLVSIIAIGFINRNVRSQILAIICQCKPQTNKHNSTIVHVRPLRRATANF